MTGASRLRLLLAWGGAAVAVNVLVFAVTATSDHVGGGIPQATLEVVIGLSFVGCGLLGWLRRPENNTGRLLVATGFVWDAGTLSTANNAILYTIGGLLGALVIAVFAHLLLAYPSGELRSRFERRLVTAGYTLAVVANVAELLVDPSPQCDNCPTNVLLVHASPTAANVFVIVIDILALALLVGVGVLMVRHWRAASTAARRGLGSILASGGGAVLLLALSFAADPVSSGLRDILSTLGLLVFASVPFFFVAVLLRSRLARGGLAELLVDVSESSSVASAEESLQRVLGDPSLRLAVWFLGRDTFIDGDGEPFEGGDVCALERVAVGFEDELGRPLALVEHDPALLEERELLEAALAGARLALQRNRLQWELKMQLAELKRSRARLVEAADAERRRLERNLHDGAQQRLVVAFTGAAPGSEPSFAPIPTRRSSSSWERRRAPARAAGAARAGPRPAPGDPRRSRPRCRARVAGGPLAAAGRARRGFRATGSRRRSRPRRSTSPPRRSRTSSSTRARRARTSR